MSKTKSDDALQKPVDPGLQRQIDENLKLLYEQCMDKGLPPALQGLIDRLRSESGPTMTGPDDHQGSAT